MGFTHMEIREVPKERAKKMVLEYNPLKYLPQLNDIFLGGFIDGEFAAVMTLGWGVRPRHTIQKCFPSLDVKDYRSIGRLAAVEELPKNTESHFIGKAITYIKRNYDFPILYTWADGMLGKPGIVYQASNFYYGNYIWTDTYVSDDGERVHPRQTNRIGGRPSYEELQELGWQHYRGMQLRYVYPLDDERWSELRQESDMDWTRGEFLKYDDLEWKVQTDSGWDKSPEPDVDITHFNHNDEKRKQLKAHEEQHELGAFTRDGPRWDRYSDTDLPQAFNLDSRS